MRLLWVPHAPLGSGRSRTEHLVERLARKHEVSVLSFRSHRRKEIWHYFVDLFTHRTKWNGLYREVAMWRFPKLPGLNERIFRRILRRELDDRNYDAVILTPAAYMIGQPDFAELKGKCAVVCDYLDGGHWATEAEVTGFERSFVTSADAVLCVSRGLQQQAIALNPASHYVPNGVERARYENYRLSRSTAECKIDLGITPETYVVSIIGMTCSPHLYFVDAITELARKGRNIVLLLVGETNLRNTIEGRMRGQASAVRLIGPVPYAKILTYFMASDLGLYAVDDIPYFHLATPLKIFEYGAMHKLTLVAPRLQEVTAMKLPFVRFCEANAEALAASIEQIMDERPETAFALPEQYDWDFLAGQTESIIASAIEGRRTGRDGSVASSS